MGNCTCIVCGTQSKSKSLDGDNSGYTITCKICGEYAISLFSLKLAEAKKVEKSEESHLLSGYIREKNWKEKIIPKISGENIREILKDPMIPTNDDIENKSRKILSYLKFKTQTYGQYVGLNPKTDVPVGYAKDREEFEALLRLLVDSDLVEIYKNDDEFSKVQSVIGATLDMYSPMDLDIRLTSIGWNLSRDLDRKNKQSLQGFIAIRFNNANDSDDVLACIKAISDGITDAQYVPKCIKEEHYSDTIMNKALREIRQSRFMVVDLTGDRTAVSFEAGFAHALGIDVIYVHDAAKIPNNFYAANYKMLPYTSHEHLREIIRDAIQARMPKENY